MRHSSDIFDRCGVCGCWVNCGSCQYARYEDALLLCYHPKRYEN